MSFEGFMYNDKNIDHMQSVIKIESGVWVGSSTTIVSGAEIGEGSVIGAMSLVNKKIPPFVVAAGVPARVIKPRFSCVTKLSATLKETNSSYSLDEVVEAHAKYGFKYSN